MIVYGSLVAFAQSDIKQVVAYSSIAHMGVVILGLFALNVEGLSGSVFLMISHGIVSGGLFLLVGVIYERLHTKEMSEFGGIAKVMPKFATIFAIMAMASVGLPLTIGFVGEFLSLLAFYKTSPWMTAIAGLSIIFGAVYTLHILRRTFFGEVVSEKVAGLKDLTKRELAALVPLAALVIILGVYPKPILQAAESSSTNLLAWMLKKASPDNKLNILQKNIPNNQGVAQ
jgi:NADH-quinone oxidoreductase subunit M